MRVIALFLLKWNQENPYFINQTYELSFLKSLSISHPLF